MTEAGLIYAKWCGYCNAMKPAWDAMKERLEKHIKIIEIEADDPRRDSMINDINNRIIGEERLVLQGYPTLFKIVNNILTYYNGERTTEDMIAFFSTDLKETKGGKAAKKVKAKRTKRTKKSKAKKSRKNITRRARTKKSRK